MSKSQTLRALVNERLAAAAEEIFVLFERTIAEYEEELCRCKEENQRKQQLLDQALSPRIQLVSGNVHIPSTSPGQIKEESKEQRIKQEEQQQLPVGVPESSAVCVKAEESSAVLQIEETKGENVSSDSDTDNDDDWDTQTEAGGPEQVQIRYRSSSLSLYQTTVHNGDMSGADGVQGKKYHCPFCQVDFRRKSNLERHVRIHTGERPYSCTICKKTFAHQSYLDKHNIIHTGEKPYTCPECHKTFTRKTNLTAHRRRHTGEKPYSCAICKKTFAFKSALGYHRKTHTGEKPYSCTFCDKAFVLKSNLDFHKKTNAHKRKLSAARSGTKLCNPQELMIAHRAHGDWSQNQSF